MVAAVTLLTTQAAIGSSQAATTVTVSPAAPEHLSYSAPFGQSQLWPANLVWVYKNVPAFSLKAGDTVAFDLSGGSAPNDINIQLAIAMAPTTTNGGDVNAGGYTPLVPNTQVPANPKGDSVEGNYELRFTSQAAFTFAGGGLLIRFSNPGGAFAADPDAVGDGVEGNTASSADPSGFFVSRYSFDSDGMAPYTGTQYFSGIGGFQLTIADVPATSNPTTQPTPTTSAPAAKAKTKAKKCKKKHKRAAAAKKCRKKRK